MAETALAQLASSGVLGIVLVLSLLALVRKDAALRETDNARIEDAQKFNTLCLSLQKEVITAISTLSKIAELWEKKEEDRQRLARELAMQTQNTPREMRAGRGAHDE